MRNQRCGCLNVGHQRDALGQNRLPLGKAPNGSVNCAQILLRWISRLESLKLAQDSFRIHEDFLRL